jgi:hypothetical protein
MSGLLTGNNMHDYATITITVLSFLGYAGLHLHVYFAAKPLKKINLYDQERAEFIVEKMLHASKNAGALCRLCSECKRVVHRYDLSPEGKVSCYDCTSPRGK